MDFYPNHWYRQPPYFGVGQAPDPNAPNAPPPGAPPGAPDPSAGAPPSGAPAPGPLAPTGPAPDGITPPKSGGKFDSKALISPAIGAGLGAVIGGLGGAAVRGSGKVDAVVALVGAVAGGLVGWKLVEIKPHATKPGTP